MIEDNILYNNKANAMDLDGIQSSTIRNNIIYGNARHGVRAFRVDGAAGPKSLTIVNNTIAIPASASSNPIKLSEDLGGHTIFNNILLNDSSAGTIVTGTSAVKSNFNVVGGSGTPSFSTNGGSTKLSLAQWRANLANDLDSILSSAGALFVNAAAADYRLRSGAPAANTGRGSFNGAPAPANDIDDVARPKGGQFDVGAHESF